MAFAKNNFYPLLGVINDQMPNVWIGTDTTATATLDTAGYFPSQKPGADTCIGIRDGDLLLYYNSSATTWNAYRFIVNASTGACDVGDGTVIGLAANTD